MRDTKELLSETRDRIAPPLDVLGSLERRRHHREQVRRGSAAVVGIVIALVGLGGWFVMGRDAAKLPVDDPTPSDLGIFAPVAGRIVYGDVGGRSGGIFAVDPARPDDPEDRLLVWERGGEPVGWSSDGSRLLIRREVSDPERDAVNDVDLFVLDADGTETRVTKHRSWITGSISPDGSQVAYAPGGTRMFIVDTDGGEPHLLLDSDDLLYQPTFSPDGTQIAYIDGGGDHTHDVWVMNTDGSDAHEIVSNEWTDSVGHVEGLTWSPAGDRIALGLDDGPSPGIYTFAPDGSDFTKVIPGGAMPHWSPDGTQIAYTDGGLVIADADGTQAQDGYGGSSGPWHPGVGGDAGEVLDDEPSPALSVVREGGEFIVFTPRASGAGWDLGAQDPETGEVRTIVETDGIVDCAERATRRLCENYIRKAEWSADGRWVAFEVTNASLDGPALGPCLPTIGIWIHGPNGVPRQLTTPCDDPGSGSNDAVEALWEWSPAHTALAYVRIDGEGDELFVIDPSDGTRTSLGTGTMDQTNTTQASKLVWSPDGTQIAYADGSSVFAIDVDTGDRSLLADSFEDIIDIAWSPNGAQVLVHDQGRYRIQVMNADGSDLHVVLEGEDACCETAWSPNGDRIVYMLSVSKSGGRFDSQVWTVAPDGSNQITLFDSASCGGTRSSNTDSLPVWAPNGTQVAYLGCDGWVAENADGTGEVQPIEELVWRSWYGGGLGEWDLAGIGQMHH